MKSIKHGRQSFVPENPPFICAWASTVGKKESQGPLHNHFDVHQSETYFGEKTWEQAENKMQQITLESLMTKAKIGAKDVDIVFSGDLLNQCIGSSFTLNNTGLPHLGIYGACSTMAEGLLLSTLALESGYAGKAIAMTSSHFAASERQYRFPLGYGGQRPPTSQWTVTGAGAALICREGKGPRITACTIGAITDWGITDANNMGAAMAPAAFATIQAHMEDLGVAPSDYDLIVTGDLGHHGESVLLTLAQQRDISLEDKLVDCGSLIFDSNTQDVHAGGSGCGCSAVTLCGYLLEKLNHNELKNILFCGTGALLSPTSTQQGKTIPGVCHAVSITGG